MNVFQQRLMVATSLTVLAAGFAAPAHASAFYLQEQSTRAIGRAFSGEVADTGAASLWWNPAAIGGLKGGNASIGATWIHPSGNVDNVNTIIVRPGQAPAAVGGDQRSKDPINNGVLPSGAVAYGIGKVSFGLAISAPYNFTTDYASTSWARYTAQKTSLRTIDIQPTVAVEVVPGLSIGAGPNIEYAKATLSNALPNLSPLLADGSQQLKGKGWDVGFSAGAQFHQGPISIGLSYKSSIKHKLDGTVTTSGLLGPLAGSNSVISTQATFRTPWQINAGIRVAATDKLTLNGQVTRLGWKKFDFIQLGSPLNVAIPENYRNSWSYAVGADYALTDKVTIRGGVQRALTPTQDGNRDARVPDSNRWTFAGGGSLAVSKALTIDAAALYTKFATATIDRTTAAYAGTAVQTPILVNGQLDKANALVLSLGARLSF